MPKCKICGKVLKNPKSSSHIKSKYHQEKLASSPSITPLDSSPQYAPEKNDFIKLKNLVFNLEKRMNKIEKQLNSIRDSSELKIKKKSDIKARNIQKLEKEIVMYLLQLKQLDKLIQVLESK